MLEQEKIDEYSKLLKACEEAKLPFAFESFTNQQNEEGDVSR